MNLSLLSSVEFDVLKLDKTMVDDMVNNPKAQAIIAVSYTHLDVYKRQVYLHCRSSQRSYNACMALVNRGYRNVWNISGSYLGICLYEYFTDVTTGREKIVTEYNFK